MPSDQNIENLTTAAETLYQYCEHGKGFFGGMRTNQNTHRSYEVWNNFSGCKTVLENKLHRKLTQAEVTILSLAVGYGPTPLLSEPERQSAMDQLWSRSPTTGELGCYQEMMNVLVSF